MREGGQAGKGAGVPTHEGGRAGKGQCGMGRNGATRDEWKRGNARQAEMGQHGTSRKGATQDRWKKPGVAMWNGQKGPVLGIGLNLHK